jgi:hypothetical protein
LLKCLTLELGEDLVGVLGPGEGTTALVPAVTEPPDRCHHLLHAGEVPAAQRLALDDGEEHLDQVQPGRIGRVKWRWIRGWLVSQVWTLACLWVA